jgi:hypothetical protein
MKRGPLRRWLANVLGQGVRFGRLGLLGLLGLVGCDESGPRVYTAMAYHADVGCLDAYAPLGLVQSVDLSATCDPVCLKVGGALYVSTVCAPYPSEAVVVAKEDSADCRAALAALGAGTLCGNAPAPEGGLE